MRNASIAALGGLGVITGCATAPANPVAARVVVMPSRQLKISDVQADDRAPSVLIRGRVARRSMMPGPIWGHLHIEAWRAGEMVTWTDTRWSQLSRHRLPTSSFSAKLAVPPTQVDEIRISHATTSHRRVCKAGTCP